MRQSNIQTLSLTCPSCGGAMELSGDKDMAFCPYCGHEMLIDREDSAGKEYEKRMAEARAEDDINTLREKKQLQRRFKGVLIALCVAALLIMVSIFIPTSPMHRRMFPRTVDPFTIIDIKFSGMSGEGTAELRVLDGGEGYVDADRYEVVPKTGLSNGDIVTAKVRATTGWRFEPAEKQFTVNGLTEWVLDTEQLTGDNLAAVHSNTERLIQADWEAIISSSFALDMTYKPYKLYLFVADQGTQKERNILYDTYEVKVTRKDGTVFTSYEACRYTSLRIPADGVLVAKYGSLQGFNFGFDHGFSYSQSFSGWTDAAEMDADLRNVRDEYHLTD